MKRKEKNKRIGDKIRLLRHEGKSESEAVGEAEGMANEGRLGRGGKYRRVKRSRRR